MESRARTLLAAAGSVILHGAAGWALFLVVSSHDGGLTQRQSDSISATAVETIVVEAVPDTVDEPPAASAAQSAVEAPDTPKEHPTPEPQPEPMPEQTPPPQQVVEQNELAAQPDPAAEQKLAEPKPEPKREEPKPEPEHKKVMDKASSRADKPRPASVNARGEARGKGTRGHVTASRGDLLSYAARVRARVAGRKPAGIGHRGTAVVVFSVSASGSVTSASIAQSSGSGTLDHASIAAVRSAGPFPSAPDQRTHSFSIPFHFK